MTTAEPGWSTPSQGIFQDVLAERWRQLQKWGPQTHRDVPNSLPLYGAESNLDLRTTTELANIFRAFCDREHHRGHGTWMHILLEEVFEAFAESGEKLREELVQSAAVIFAWIEDLDRRQFARVVEPVPVFTDQMAGVPA